LFIQDRRQKRQAGRDGRKTLELRPESRSPGIPGAEAPRGAVIAARQPGPASRERDAVWLGAGLAAVTRVLRNRAFHQQVIVGVIVAAALARMALEGLSRSVRALVAWDNARLAELEEQLRRQHVGGALDGPTLSARQPGRTSRQRDAILVVVVLVAAARTVRARRFEMAAIVGAMALAAVAQVGRKDLASSLKALVAWDNARLAELNKELRRKREAEASQDTAS
jgi:hypothetical protein